MKNFTITLLCTLFGSAMFAQTYTTGTMNLSSVPGATALNYSAKIDVTASLVTLTLIGPSTSWLGIGFNATGMDDVGMDAVIFDGTNMTDRTFNGVGIVPPLDAIQNWSISSNTITAGVRTVVATRARNTGDSNDYVFLAAAQPLNIVYARRVGSLVVAYHGLDSCGTTVANLTLGTTEFKMDEFKMYPNPSKGYLLIEFPSKLVNEGEVKIYDNLGRVVRKQTITQSENRVNTSDLTTGNYIVALRTEYGNATKTLIID